MPFQRTLFCQISCLVKSSHEYQSVNCKTNSIIPNVGYVVNVYDEKQRRQKWLLGQITDLRKVGITLCEKQLYI